MRHKIIEKINTVMKEGIERESEVLYILAQCRKYLEASYSKEERERNYPTISLVGDWVLHTELTGKGAKKKVREYADFLSKQEEDISFNFMTSKFTLFPDLKTEFSEFNKNFGVNQLITDKKIWRNFVRLLIRILQDLPLRSKEDDISFTFNEGFIVTGKEAVSFSISYKDGRNHHFDIDLDLIDR